MSNEPPDAVAALIARHVAPDGSVTIPPRLALWIAKRLGRELDRRLLMRVTDFKAYVVLSALYQTALEYEETGCRTAIGPKEASQQRDSTEWVTTRQAARLTGVGDSAIRKRIRGRKLPAERHGGRWLIHRRHLNMVNAIDA